MTYRIEARVLPEQSTAVVAGHMSVSSMPEWLAGAYQEIMSHLRRAGVAPAGPPFARFVFRDGFADVEAGFPVSAPVAPGGRVTPSTLPAGPVAATTHYGPYERLTDAYQAVTTWLAEHGRQADGPHWEVYYTDPQTEADAARWRTDVVAPYRAGARPHVVVHNMTSLDGRMTGFPLDLQLFYEIAGGLEQQAVLTGSGTIVDAAEQEGVDLSGEDPEGPQEKPPDDPRPWLVIVDGRGRLTRLNWLRNQPYWRDVLILCHQSTPPGHLDRLRGQGVAHLVAGTDQVDLAAALHLLADRYGVRQVRVDAGGTLNAMLLRAGLVDEVSVILAPYLAGAGDPGSAHLVGALNDIGAQRMNLAAVRQLRSDHVWLRYTVTGYAAAPGT